MQKETIEESAARIWSITRDLATGGVSGTALNSERGARHIASLIKTYAAMHADEIALANEAAERGRLVEVVRGLRGELKALKEKLVETGGVT